MFNKKLILALAIAASFSSANAVIVENNPPVSTAANSNANVTTYTATDGEISYNNKNLANYQDPYLTNPRAYKSNEYGEAAPAPKRNSVFVGQAPVYNAREARQLQETIEPASGQPIDATEY